MSRRVFCIADTHFGHQKIIEYCRPQYADTDEMDQDLVYRWNQVVRQQDIVYHMGDVALVGSSDERQRYVLDLLCQLHGEIRLVGGNHDNTWIAEAFDAFYGVRERKRCLMSHIPIHPAQLEDRFKLNIHGHLHDKEVTCPFHLDPRMQVTDRRYVCVSVEHTDYAPRPFDDIVKERLG